MKRLSIIVSLAVCMSLVFGANALGQTGQYEINLPDVTVSEGATVEYEYNGIWMSKIVQITVPAIIREVDAGSFWTGTLPCDTVDGTPTNVTWQWAVPNWANMIQEARPGVPASPCGAAGDVGYDGVTPDHLSVSAQGMGTENAAPAPGGRDFVKLTFQVTNTPGDFEIDTACFTGSLNRIYLIDDSYTDHGASTVFSKGTITIEPNECPTVATAR